MTYLMHFLSTFFYICVSNSVEIHVPVRICFDIITPILSEVNVFNN